MKNLYNTLFISVALATSCQSIAKEGNPAFWLVMPFAKAISTCSVYGPEIRQQLTDAIKTGNENSKGKLPENIWTLLGSGNSSTESKEPSAAIKKACDEVVAFYKNPQFATQFRQTIVAQLVSSPALQCIIEQPTQARQIKEAWSRAFLRNGLELSEHAIDETVENARPYIKNQKPGTGPSLSDCEQIAAMFSSQEFDAKYGEKGVYDLFSEY